MNANRGEPKLGLTAARRWLGLGLVLALVCRASAEVRIETRTTDDGSTLVVYAMRVTPAAEPIPALKHRLTVSPFDLKPGNAATHYLRLFPEGGIDRRMENVVTEYGDAFHTWYNAGEMPLEELPLDKASQAAREFDALVGDHVARAVVRRDCDWGRGLDELRGSEIVMVALPEINASRSVARVLALRARVAIAQRDYPRAIHELRMIYRLAEHVGSEPLLVSGLVGIAEASMANEQLVELIAAENSPNLYWAVAGLPDPIVSIQAAVRYEMTLGPRIFPFLLDAEDANYSPEQWGRLFADALEEFGHLTSNGPVTNHYDRAWRQAAVTGMALLTYPQAKQRLIDSGMSPDKVIALPVGQVIAVDALREWRRAADEMEKWMYVPFVESRRFDPAPLFEDTGARAIQRGYGYVMASLLLPAVGAARTAEVRLERHLRAIQVVEAVRMHAAKTGSLPDSLDDIEIVPVPLNPATARPFDYRLDGKTAVLELPKSDGFVGIAWRFEVTLAE